MAAMDDLDRQYKENVRSIALGFVTDSFRARVTKGREVIQDFLQRIGQEIELVMDDEKKHLEWFKQKMGSDDAAKPQLRRLQQDLRPPPWRSARVNLSVPLTIDLADVTSPCKNTSDPREDTAIPVPGPQDTPGPSSSTHSPVAKAESTNSASPPASDTKTTATNKPDEIQNSYDGTPTSRSRKRKTPHGEPVSVLAGPRRFNADFNLF